MNDKHYIKLSLLYYIVIMVHNNMYIYEVTTFHH